MALLSQSSTQQFDRIPKWSNSKHIVRDWSRSAEIPIAVVGLQWKRSRVGAKALKISLLCALRCTGQAHFAQHHCPGAVITFKVEDDLGAALKNKTARCLRKGLLGLVRWAKNALNDGDPVRSDNCPLHTKGLCRVAHGGEGRRCGTNLLDYIICLRACSGKWVKRWRGTKDGEEKGCPHRAVKTT